MSIIKNKDVFNTNFIPEKIPVRNDLVNEICSKIKLSDRYNLLLTGLTGNGKTMSMKKVIEKWGMRSVLFMLIVLKIIVMGQLPR